MNFDSETPALSDYWMWEESIYSNKNYISPAEFIPTEGSNELYKGNESTDLFQLRYAMRVTSIDYQNNPVDDYKSDAYEHKESWRRKPVKQWENTDVLQWINCAAETMNICCTDINGPMFRKVDGFRLLEMSESDFEKCDDKYGKILYKQFKKIISEDPSSVSMVNNCNYVQTYTLLGSDTDGCKYDNRMPSMNHFNDTDSYEDVTSASCLSNEQSHQCTNQGIIKNRKNQANHDVPFKTGRRNGPGRPKSQRPKKKQEKKLGRLWEFIRDLLKDREYCPRIICWENHDDGMFRFVHSDKVAKLWGIKKDNPEMNYEKLSRAMRYYYRSLVLQPVIGRRLVYKFGPNAKGWRCENPNFKN